MNKRKKSLPDLKAPLVTLMLLSGATSFANEKMDRLSLQLQGVTIEEALNSLSKELDIEFAYSREVIKSDKQINVNLQEVDLGEAISQIFENQDVSWEVNGSKVYLTSGKASTQQNIKQQTITGVIVDDKGEPIIGATIIEKGNNANGTLTDFDGNFSLNVPQNAVLVISYMGYVSQEIKVGDQKTLKIRLKEDSKALDEVVVVGFGSQKKANMTGAVSSVNMEETIGNRPILTVGDALQGAVPGLRVGNGGNAPGTSKSFQIRGAYSIGVKNSDGSYGNTISPLVLVDNVEGDINMVNPEDIETISVLKDAASTAIYGARAAGGVILITTKRAKSDTRFQLNYNNNFGIGHAQNLPKQAPLMDYLQAYRDAAGDQYWSIGSPSVSKWMEYLTAYRKDPSQFDIVGDGMFKDTDGAVYYLNEKDLVKNFLTNSFQMTHNISATGGTDKVRYRISGSYVSSDGVLISNKDKYDRLNIQTLISADVTSWFTQEATMSYAHSKNTLPSSALGAIYSTRLGSYYPEGMIPGSISGADKDLPSFTSKNQIEWSNTSRSSKDVPRIFLKSILKPFKNFQGVFEYTFNKDMYDYHWYTGSNEYTTIQGGLDKTPSNDYLRKQKQYTNYNAFNIYGTYDLTLGDNKFKIMGGFNQESQYRELLDAFSYGQAVIGVPGMASGTSTIKVTDSYNEYSVRGGFFRLNYTYLDKYLVEANGRYDGSSKFPKSSRFGFFPSVSAGWQIAQEDFMQFSRNWLDALKLRGSYGEIGNQNVPAYSFIPTMSVDNKFNGWLQNGDFVTAISSLPALVSTTFTWEKVSTVNVGLDLTMLNNRLTGTAEWYVRDTKGMLAPGMQLPAVVGASSPYQNTADMQTKGWEVSLNWRDNIGQLGYRIGFNLTDYKSKITKYNANEAKLLSNFYEGQELGEIWGYVADGFYTIDDFENTSSWTLKEGVAKLDGFNPRPGDLKFQNLRDDEKGTNLITSGNNTYDNPGDRKKLGNNQPRYLYGITLGGNYKGFDLNIFMDGVGKRDAWIANTLTFPLYSDFKFVALYDGLTDYWTPVDFEGGDFTAANPNARFPRIYGNYGNSGSNYRTSDRYLSDASYFRIKNVTLSYSVPKKWTNPLHLNLLKGFVSVENLATFSSLAKGIDPETLGWNYPSFRTVSFGVSLTL